MVFVLEAILAPIATICLLSLNKWGCHFGKDGHETFGGAVTNRIPSTYQISNCHQYVWLAAAHMYTYVWGESDTISFLNDTILFVIAS